MPTALYQHGQAPRHTWILWKPFTKNFRATCYHQHQNPKPSPLLFWDPMYRAPEAAEGLFARLRQRQLSP